MRKIATLFILLIVSSVLILSGCAVNSTTGKITIVNRSTTSVSNIKIGSTILALAVGPGQSVDYFFTSALSGALTATGAKTGFAYDETNDVERDGTFTFKLNNWYSIGISLQYGTVYIGASPQGVQGQDAEDTDWAGIYDDFYEE